MHAPVVVFAYKRIDTLKRTIQALVDNELSSETDLIVFSDAPRWGSDAEAVGIVRAYLPTIVGFKTIRIIEREQNFGLATNTVRGVTSVLEEYESVIVLEDDIVVARHFLNFMNDALRLYAGDEKVCQVAGYSYLEKFHKRFDLPETYFFKGGDCLAWGTWRQSWSAYCDDARELANRIQAAGLMRQFNRNNSYNFFKMLRNSTTGRAVSWAVKWHAANFLADRYILHPLKSLALHIGTEGATNYDYVGSVDPYHVPLYQSRIPLTRVPILETSNVTMAYNSFLREARGPFMQRLARSATSRIQRLFGGRRK